MNYSFYLPNCVWISSSSTFPS